MHRIKLVKLFKESKKSEKKAIKVCIFQKMQYVNKTT